MPLVALADAGGKVPGLPRYRFDPTPGDAQGFYAAAREFMAAWGRPGALELAGLMLGVLAAAAVCVVLVRRGLARWAVPAGALAAALLLAAVIAEMSRHTGAAVVGWSLVWGTAMLPYRAVGGPLDPRIAFGFGLALALAAIATTTVCTWLIGLRASRSRAIALGAAWLYALWPLIARPLSGPGAWQNGTWHVDVGLHLYDEPFSTALVAAAFAILLREEASDVLLAVAGVLLGYAVAVRLSNALLAGIALLFVARRVGVRRAAPFALGVVSFVPVVAAWWPRGYAALFDRPDVWPRHAFALSHVRPAWTDSLLFTPRLLVVLVPLALIGTVSVRRHAAALLGGAVLVTAVFYSFYAVTPMHPRFFYVVFPALFTLVTAGALRLAEAVVAAAVTPRSRAGGP